jgi:hypothetical protein
MRSCAILKISSLLWKRERGRKKTVRGMVAAVDERRERITCDSKSDTTADSLQLELIHER